MEGPAEGGGACLSLQILQQNGEWIQSRPAPPAGVRRILRATPFAAGPCFFAPFGFAGAPFETICGPLCVFFDILELRHENELFWALIWRGRRQWGALPESSDSAEHGEWIPSRPAPPAGVRRILRATPSAAGPHSREEGCVEGAMLC